MDKKEKGELLRIVLEAQDTGDKSKLAKWWREHFPGYKWWLIDSSFTLILPDDGRIEP